MVVSASVRVPGSGRWRYVRLRGRSGRSTTRSSTCSRSPTCSSPTPATSPATHTRSPSHWPRSRRGPASCSARPTARTRSTACITIGGDHTIAYALLKAMHRRFGKVALVHFDAHLDTWDTYFGERFTHGTPFRRAAEEGLFDTDASMHVGIRGPIYSPSDYANDAALGFSHDQLRRPAATSVSTRSPSESALASAIARCTCRSTSTCSTRPTHRAPERRRSPE